ncbi:class I SAM-dependent methyltransferase [Beggiatoa leptomitoformis]|uniref:Methyltransferase domain-containing protein n=1 Tax=Beggiatoa leptomitoformis TaxID=288004 RepID=A0A2N9YEA4_9GAMM|nr:methyltransferase domain-containing protein [Beggiatoa leptomitoformis]ALG68824.1 methyltransferase domain-containing protein [Beggiatoa leptomitoformis]AUI68812.1 methyltransferase domain-containing protein [Beggiatoa leptomitoformis]
MDLQKIYSTRFLEEELPAKNRIWKVICEDFLSKFIKKTDTVVDIGAGYCEFINNIQCGKKIAIDLNPDVKKFAADNIQILNESCMAISSLDDDSADIVFMSNFLEHLQDKKQVLETIEESKRILKVGGCLLILQPNIRFLADVYWDFFDHHVPLSDRSLVEILESLDMQIIKNYPKFLPYTTKSRLPKSDFFVKLYLRIPLAWQLFGKQAFIVAKKV